jgi:hypothetical protein
LVDLLTTLTRELGEVFFAPFALDSSVGRGPRCLFPRAEFHPAYLAGDRLRQLGELEAADALVWG